MTPVGEPELYLVGSSRAGNSTRFPLSLGLSLATSNDTADRKLPPAPRMATAVGCPPLSERGALSLECPPLGSNVQADDNCGAINIGANDGRVEDEAFARGVSPPWVIGASSSKKGSVPPRGTTSGGWSLPSTRLRGGAKVGFGVR